MEIAASKSYPGIWRLALIGAATAFAWIILSLLLGLGSAQAQADERDDEGLLGALSSVVDKSASTVGAAANGVTGGAVEAVNTVVSVAPAPVREPVHQVATGVGAAVSAVAEPVVTVVSTPPVTAVTEPVAELVDDLPVVGELGLGETLGGVAVAVDDSLSDLVGAVTDAGSQLGVPPVGEFPGLPELPALPASPAVQTPVEGHPLPALGAVLAAAGAPLGDTAGAASTPSLFAAGVGVDAVAVRAAAGADPRLAAPTGGGLCPSSASSSGPAGAGSGAWALVALGPIAALRAWGRRAGPQDENAPPAPAASTDVSPD